MKNDTRLQYLEWLRFIAVICIIPGQIFEAYRPVLDNNLKFLTYNMLSTFTAPLFVLVSGAGYFIWSQKQVSHLRLRNSIKRGLLLIIFGIIIDRIILKIIMLSGPLQYIGQSYILMGILEKFKYLKNSNKTFCIMFTLLVFTPLLQSFFKIEQYWNPEKTFFIYLDPWPFYNLFHEPFISGYLVVFPWMIFSLLGYKLAENKTLKMSYKTIVTAILLTALGPILTTLSKTKVSLIDHYVLQWNDYQYPMTTSILLTTLGVLTLFFYLIRATFTNNSTSQGKVSRLVLLYSKYSLSCYFLNIIFYNSLIPKIFSYFNIGQLKDGRLDLVFPQYFYLGYINFILILPILIFFDFFNGAPSLEFILRKTLNKISYYEHKNKIP